MLIKNLLDLIDTNSEDIAIRWKNEIIKSEYTKNYAKLSERDLIKKSTNVYQNLRSWLEPDFSRVEIGRAYVLIGKERYKEGVPLCEVTFALNLTKKVLWEYLLSKGIMTNALELFQAMEFITGVYNFFDMAIFYLIRGYHEALYKKAVKGKTGKNIAADIFPEGSFFYKMEPEYKQFEKFIQGFNLFKTR